VRARVPAPAGNSVVVAAAAPKRQGLPGGYAGMAGSENAGEEISPTRAGEERGRAIGTDHRRVRQWRVGENEEGSGGCGDPAKKRGISGERISLGDRSVERPVRSAFVSVLPLSFSRRFQLIARRHAIARQVSVNKDGGERGNAII